MAHKESKHTCYFTLEQTVKGYFTGNFICTFCGAKIPQSQWLENVDPTKADFSSPTSPHDSSSDIVDHK